MGTVIGALTDRGYGVGWRVLDAQYFGVAQRRRRVFIVGCLRDDGAAPSEILALCEGLSGDTPSRKSKGQNPATDAGTGAPIGFSHTQGLDAQPSTDNFPTLRVGGAGHAVAKPMLLTQREGKPGGGKGPLISEDISLTLATGNGQVLINPNDVTVRRLTPTECERLQGFPDGWTAERIDEVKGLVTQADSARYKQMGNAVAVPCVEWIVNRLVEIDRDR